MTTMTLDLPETLYQQLHYRSQQSHRPIEVNHLADIGIIGGVVYDALIMYVAL